MKQTHEIQHVCHNTEARTSKFTPKLTYTQFKPLADHHLAHRRTATIRSLAVLIWRLVTVVQKINTKPYQGVCALLPFSF